MCRALKLIDRKEFMFTWISCCQRDKECYKDGTNRNMLQPKDNYSCVSYRCKKDANLNVTSSKIARDVYIGT